MTKRIISVLLTVCIAISSFTIISFADGSKTLEEKLALIYEQIVNDSEISNAIQNISKPVVFISVSDGKKQAKVVYARDNTLKKAFDKAAQKAYNLNMTAYWVKCDVVTDIEAATYSSLKNTLINTYPCSFRKGIAFNDYFGRALLEAELNSNDFINYDNGKLKINNINKYFSANNKIKLDKIPSTLYVFDTKAYFCDDNSVCYELNDNYRRATNMNRKALKQLCTDSSDYYGDILKDDGSFYYGFKPVTARVLSSYNNIRHAGAVWNLILQYKITKDKNTINTIDSSIEYMLSQCIYKDKNTAFLLDVPSNEFKLGGNGIAVLALSEYMDAFNTDKYMSELKALANGIIYMQRADGGFNHVYNTDFTLKEAYRVIFFDGEAMFALAKAYGTTGSEKYLSACEKSADYFIANKYETQHSHWISYGFNELTKYVPKEKYLSFGLKNVDGYTYAALRNQRSTPTQLETLMAAFELYDRIMVNGYECSYLEEFDADALIKSIKHRVEYGMNFFVFPEYAMYFKLPQRYLSSFAVREDYFRLRIDDIQHFMGGYCLYYDNYSRVQSY